MIIKFGKKSDCDTLLCKLPSNVADFLKENLRILDDAYGINRNHYKEGGYIIYADDNNDIEKIKETVITSIYEWIEKIDGYIVELHLLGDDFAVIFCHPEQ